jgi:RND family efflux transporter MFP subunit
VIAAPISGYLLTASARAGDMVSAGEELASLNDNDLRLEQTKLNGQLQKLQRQYRQAQSTRDLVQVNVIREQINQAKAEIELNSEQLDKTKLLAPFDGVVIEGDLNQRLGSPVERGDSLFKIAPLEGYRIILKVDETQIAYIKPGQSGELVLSSLPNSTLQLGVKTITAVAKADNGANIFRVEAELNNAPELLRPGMQGVGRINTGKASLWWIYTHNIQNTLRLWLWSWLP